jgi:hypothetical protein
MFTHTRIEQGRGEGDHVGLENPRDTVLGRSAIKKRSKIYWLSRGARSQDCSASSTGLSPYAAKAVAKSHLALH